MGHARYLLFYLISGVVAALVHKGLAARSDVPGGRQRSSPGDGRLLLYSHHHPDTDLLLHWFVEVPALLFIGFWFFSQLFGSVIPWPPGQTAFARSPGGLHRRLCRRVAWPRSGRRRPVPVPR